MKPYPDFRHELPYWQNNTYVIGIDEVGRGCLAGPVYVGGVCFPFLTLPQQLQIQKLKIHDSKLCTHRKRQKLTPRIIQSALSYKIACSSVEEINKLGIVPAIEQAAIRIILFIAARLPAHTNFVVFTDTLPIKALQNQQKIKQRAIPQADANTITVAAASILAKVERDEIMNTLHPLHPEYNWNRNKGYATKTHREAIQRIGTSSYHRDLYVRKVLSRRPSNLEV